MNAQAGLRLVGIRARTRAAVLATATASLLALPLIPAAAQASGPPTITTNPAEEVGITTAKLSGTVNPHGEAGHAANTTWYLQYAPIGTGAWQNANTGKIEGAQAEEANPIGVEAIFGFGGELKPSSEYEFRLYAEGPEGFEETNPHLTFTTQAATAPTLHLEPPSGVSPQGVHLEGTIDPEGGNVNQIGSEAIPIFWQLQYEKTSEPGNWQLAEAGEIKEAEAESTNPIAVKAEPANLIPATEYQARLLVNYAGAEEAIAPEEPTFTTPAAAPRIESTFASDVLAETAILHAKINPGGASTTYRFQYTTEAEYNANEFTGAKEVEGSSPLGPAYGVDLATAEIEGLKPGVPYVFRVIVGSSVDSEVVGPTTHFETLEAEEAAHECPNERLREESNLDPNTERPYSTELPDCRAFELVSPPAHGLTIIGTGVPSADGSQLLAVAVGSFSGGSSTANVLNPYLFSRTESGWRTTPLEPPPSQLLVAASSGAGIGVGQNPYTPSGEALVTARPAGAPQFEANLYRRSASGAFTEVGPLTPPSSLSPLPGNDDKLPLGRTSTWFGASADLDHSFFSTGAWPGASGGLYEYTGTGNSEPELVAVENEGTVEAAAQAAHDPHLNEAAQPIPGCTAIMGMPLSLQNGHSANAHNDISADGEAAFFTCEGSGFPTAEIFARLHRAETVPISAPPLQSECHEAGGCKEDATTPADFRDAAFQGASANGKVVFFLSPQRLLDSATQDPRADSPLRGQNCGTQTAGDSGCNLYAYDFEKPEDERLIDLSAGDTSGQGPQVQGVATVSEDGSHAYFVAKGVLTAAPNQFGATARAGQNNLYAYDLATDEVAFVATLSSEYREEFQWNSSGEGGQEFAGPMQTTPDGRYLLFLSAANPTPDAAGASLQLYRYDSATGRLLRVSIGAAGFNHDGNGLPDAFAPVTNFSRSDAPEQSRSPAIAEDGAVVFESRAALTPAAVEGARNFYEYEGGHVRLLFASLIRRAAGLAGIGASGRDIYFTTPEPILPADVNTGADVYDVRVGGGFPAPARPRSCEGDACQPGEAPPPAPPGPLSPGFAGAEEGPRHPQAPSHRHHHKKHRHSHRKRAGHNRGGKR